MKYAVSAVVVLRCTRQLLMRLKYANEDPSERSTTRLGDWYGTLIRFGRRHVVLFINERSRLPVLLPVRHADRLTLAFPAAVSEVLAGIGVSTTAIDQERSLMLPIHLGPPRNRSLIGSLNEFAFLARMHFITKRDDPLNVIARELAEVPLILPFNGDCASMVTRRLFGID